MRALCGVLASALPAHAADFTPPTGCTVQLTAQLRNCQVANYYTCAGDPVGDQRVAYADGKGVYFVSHIDSETRWLESVSLETGEVEQLDQANSADNASFSELLATGRDDYDFVTRSNFGELRRYVGEDRLSGQQVTIDGVPLEICEFDLTEYDAAGAPVSTRKGMQYISRKYRVFFGGAEDFENAQGDRVSSDESPARFDFPGDRGFSSQTPEYDCDLMMTGYAPAGGQL